MPQSFYYFPKCLLATHWGIALIIWAFERSIHLLILSFRTFIGSFMHFCLKLTAFAVIMKYWGVSQHLSLAIISYINMCWSWYHLLAQRFYYAITGLGVRVFSSTAEEEQCGHPEAPEQYWWFERDPEAKYDRDGTPYDAWEILLCIVPSPSCESVMLDVKIDHTIT